MAAGSHTTLGPWARMPCSGCGKRIRPDEPGWYEHVGGVYRAFHHACHPLMVQQRTLRTLTPEVYLG